MAVLLKGGAVFLHIPKTGGTWITEVLRKLNLVECEFGHQHADMDRVLHASLFPPGKSSLGIPNQPLKISIEKSTFMFCFVRHPVYWYESWWRYMHGIGWPSWGDEQDKGRWHPNSLLNGLGDNDFNSFVKKVIAVRPGYVTELYNRYTYTAINYVGRQESLANDLITVLSCLNLNFDPSIVKRFGQINTSNLSEPHLKWDSALLALIQKMEYSAIVRYNYNTLDTKEKT